MERLLRVSAYGLIRRDDRILLCRISPGVAPEQEWTLPGGGIEFGEHPADAAIREIREETGFTVRLVGGPHVDSGSFQWRDSQAHAIRLIYGAEIEAGELTHEAEGSTDRCDWFTLEETRKLPLVSLAKLGVQLAFESRD